MYQNFCSIYNATIHSATNRSPNELFFGRQLALPNAVLQEVTPTPHIRGDLESHLLNTAVRLRNVIETARKHNENQLKIAKTYFDRQVSSINSFCVGQRVFLRNPDTEKFALRYPKEYVVKRKLHNFEYEIQNVNDVKDIRIS